MKNFVHDNVASYNIKRSKNRKSPFASIAMHLQKKIFSKLKFNFEYFF